MAGDWTTAVKGLKDLGMSFLVEGPLLEQKTALEAGLKTAQANAYQQHGRLYGTQADKEQFVLDNAKHFAGGGAPSIDLPPMVRNSLYISSLNGEFDPAKITTASGNLQKQGAIADMIGGALKPSVAGPAFAASEGKPLFNAVGSTGYSVDNFTGTIDPNLKKLFGDKTRAETNKDIAQTRKTNQDIELGGKGQVVQTDAGIMLVDPRRPNSARPITTADGQPLTRPLKDMPAPAATALRENGAALRKLDAALAAVDAYPDALGAWNYLGETVRQRSDPEGIDARALIADIGSLKIHDRSGAAVTAAEFPRLAPFIPQATDNPETVKKKLQLFRKEYTDIVSDIHSTYSRDQGYRAPDARPGAPAPSGGPAGKTVVRTGTAPDGRRVVQYSDGTMDFQ